MYSILYFLCDRKYQRTRHAGKIFANALCSRRIMRALGRALVRHSRLSLVCRVLRNALRVAILRKYNCHTAFERPRTMACSHQGFTLCCLRCRCFFKNYLVQWAFMHTMVIPIKAVTVKIIVKGRCCSGKKRRDVWSAVALYFLFNAKPHESSSAWTATNSL